MTYPRDAPRPWRRVRDEVRALDGETLLAMSVLDVPGLRGVGQPFVLRRLASSWQPSTRRRRDDVSGSAEAAHGDSSPATGVVPGLVTPSAAEIRKVLSGAIAVRGKAARIGAILAAGGETVPALEALRR